jgi:DNA polymerase (family X)
MAGSNAEVARVLAELAALTELDEGGPQAFRVRAYQNAQRAVEQLGSEVATMSAVELAAVKGIGPSIAARIREFVDTGAVARLEELRERHPRGQRELLRIPGLGARTIDLLRTALGVSDVAGLRAALEDGRVAALPGMGERTATNLLRAIDQLGLGSKSVPVPLYVAMPVAERIVAVLGAVPGVVEVAYAGSLRRARETVGDLDILVAAEGDGGAITAAFLALPEVASVSGSGPTRSSMVTHDGLQVDLRIVPRQSFGAALLYFTGSKAHNIRLRQRALRRGWTLNEYTLAGDGASAVETEASLYAALGLAWIAPEMREDLGEIEAAEARALPTLVEIDDIRGDLHVHTDLSGDGRASLAAMVAAGVDRGLRYLAITDHAEDLTINGADRTAMLAQRREVRELEQQRGDVTLLHGAELNVGIDGSLDYDPSFRADYDWLVASVHSHFGRPVEQQTARIVAAMRDPAVTAIGHLSGRMIGRRPGIELDLEQVLDAAVETGTALEINASPHRLDAAPEVIREGARRGVTFVISTDAHAPAEFERLRFGIGNARRGGLDVGLVANAWPADRFTAWVERVRSGS